MLAMPKHASAQRWMIALEPGRDRAADRETLSPALRIALTIALINHGFDLLDGVARTSLARCTREVLQRRHRPEPASRALHQGEGPGAP